MNRSGFDGDPDVPHGTRGASRCLYRAVSDMCGFDRDRPQLISGGPSFELFTIGMC